MVKSQQQKKKPAPVKQQQQQQQQQQPVRDDSEHSDDNSDHEEQQRMSMLNSMAARKTAQGTRRSKLPKFGGGDDSDESDFSDSDDQDDDDEVDIDNLGNESETDASDDGEDDYNDDNDDDGEVETTAATTMDADSEKKKSKKSKKDKKNKKKVKPLTPEQLAKFQAQQARAGVVYMSRIPPYMHHRKVRQLLSRFGEIGRIYLAPEDDQEAARRKKYGGNKKKKFKEGWIEFADKSVAKNIAASLNGTKIDPKKRSFYHEDLWTLKYLNRFKWNNLTEQIAYERAAHEHRLRAEISQARKEVRTYRENVEKAKIDDAIKEKKRKRLAAAGKSTDDASNGVSEDKLQKMAASQRNVVKREAANATSMEQDGKRENKRARTTAVTNAPDSEGNQKPTDARLTSSVKNILSHIF